MRLIDADELLKHEVEADRMGAMLVVGKGYILSAPTIDCLTEYEDRDEKGCGWCNKGYRFEFNWIDDDGSTIITNDNTVIGDIADYCPKCGKKLTTK